MAQLPAGRGTYVLVCRCDAVACIKAGGVGELVVRPGWYAYVGSAFGPGGLRARIGHHLRPATSPHWHVDYLRMHAAVERVWFTAGDTRHECGWAAALGGEPVRGFGCSDCRCESHLFRFSRRPSLSGFRRRLGAGHPRVLERVIARETAARGSR